MYILHFSRLILPSSTPKKLVLRAGMAKPGNPLPDAAVMPHPPSKAVALALRDTDPDRVTGRALDAPIDNHGANGGQHEHGDAFSAHVRTKPRPLMQGGNIPY
jgi:hypothetical protein